METTEEELDQARKKTLKVQKERDDVIEDYAQSERKISMLDKKLENANKEIDGYLEEIAKLKDINAEQRQKLDDGEEERKQLHEMVQQLKGNIRVFSRVRPLLPSELEKVSIKDSLCKIIVFFREARRSTSHLTAPMQGSACKNL